MGDASPKMDSDELIGRVINDRFEILELIARGGMGRVYRARQKPLGREVALKILDPRYKGEEDPEFQARFFLEASTSAKLSHPNTVTVFDYGKTNDEIYFIVMEFVEGRTLAKLLKTEGPLEPDRAVRIAVQIARSLREAHGLGVIHRDLKPANVLLTTHADEDDFVKVLDFGLVKDVGGESEELTQAGLFMGSPKYMSPEQITGGDVDARTDVYALGVVLYFMLTGKVPFDRDTQVQTLMAHIKEEVPPMMRADGRAIPEGLKHVVMRCLSKNAADRLASMNEVVAALKHASSAMGQQLMMSGSYQLGLEGSGTRSIPGVTPSGGFATVSGGTPTSGVTFGTPSGGISTPGVAMSPASVSGVPVSFDTPVEEQKGGKGKIFFALVALALGGGATYAFLNSGEETPPVADTAVPTPVGDQVAAADPTPETSVVAQEEPDREPEVLRRVIVVLRSEPSGARVRLGGREYTTPANVELIGIQAAEGKELSFTFSLDGYDDTTVKHVIQGERAEVTAELDAIRRARRWRPSSRMTSMSSDSDDEGDDGVVITRGQYLDNPY